MGREIAITAMRRKQESEIRETQRRGEKCLGKVFLRLRVS